MVSVIISPLFPSQIYQYALRLIEKYFHEEDADTDDTLAPQQQENQFAFSQPTTGANNDGASHVGTFEF